MITDRMSMTSVTYQVDTIIHVVHISYSQTPPSHDNSQHLTKPFLATFERKMLRRIFGYVCVKRRYSNRIQRRAAFHSRSAYQAIARPSSTHKTHPVRQSVKRFIVTLVLLDSFVTCAKTFFPTGFFSLSCSL